MGFCLRGIGLGANHSKGAENLNYISKVGGSERLQSAMRMEKQVLSFSLGNQH